MPSPPQGSKKHARGESLVPARESLPSVKSSGPRGCSHGRGCQKTFRIRPHVRAWRRPARRPAPRESLPGLAISDVGTGRRVDHSHRRWRRPPIVMSMTMLVDRRMRAALRSSFGNARLSSAASCARKARAEFALFTPHFAASRCLHPQRCRGPSHIFFCSDFYFRAATARFPRTVRKARNLSM
jgi:hypothetical protein